MPLIHLRYTQVDSALRELLKAADKNILIGDTDIIYAVLSSLYEAAQLQERVDAALNCLVCATIGDTAEIAETAYKLLSGQMPVVKLDEDIIRQHEKKQLFSSRAAYRKLDDEFQELVNSIKTLATKAGLIEDPDAEEDDD